MIRNTCDGTSSPPRLRCYMNLMALEGLPQAADPLPAIKEAGYDGVQFTEPVTREQIAECERLGLGRTGLGRINEARDAFELAARLSGEGQECSTVHVGGGTEEDDEAARLIESVLDASEKHWLPIYAETHRATIFQDNWRTVQFVRRFPELRFNGDFSHWYTGSEMVYGGFENKLRFIAPVLERIRFVHGCIRGIFEERTAGGLHLLCARIARAEDLLRQGVSGFRRPADGRKRSLAAVSGLVPHSTGGF